MGSIFVESRKGPAVRGRLFGVRCHRRLPDNGMNVKRGQKPKGESADWVEQSSEDPNPIGGCDVKIITGCVWDETVERVRNPENGRDR